MANLNTLAQLACIILVLVIPSTLAAVYNVNMACGTCQKTTGCTGNMCIVFTGDVQAQYCYGNATCSVNANQTLSMGQCTTDFSGSACQSGVCAMGASISMCYGSPVCLNGVRFDQSCSNGSISMSMSGGSFGNTTFNSSVPINMTCPYTRAYGNYSTCSGDSLGGSCNCCFSMVMEGMNSVMGTCVPQDSPIIQIKSSLNTKFGFQTMVSMVLVLLQILFIAL